MGFLSGGPYYDMIGRTGNNVGRRVKGKNVFSMRPSKSNKAPTVAQVNQRLRFELVASWLRRLGSVIDIGFKEYDAQMSARNAAFSYNVLHAITGVTPNYTIDYAKVMFSKGPLDLPNDPQINVATAAKLDYSWAATTGDSNGLATDKFSFVVFNPSKNKFVTLKGGAVRSALAYSLQLPGDFSGDTVEAYFSIVSADGKMVSDSVYIGPFIVL
ncbi:DUF6266 family protein [Pedobacter heparinus]|uniref:Uncharacterized protein n=1 Tax=Pedobacter heparinus (strain ATCC 13125 / DSM 2366 / CIP 104194 / JCM 7457 / NBRC 12017 / NCIMB 9290 / NRRL B-14731 / HIM 762-3) TaxID=485917 RepID=C6Y1S5_PEDHD|nr:DUF6266 family protein [Pedobacter heparinus]ACU05067.1 hypothetical protein Phep_2869 [Pedobacter heparinus DSM 2366]